MGFASSSLTDERRAALGWMRISARAIAVIWALFWIWFGVASGIGEGLGATGTTIHAAVPGLFFLALALVPWKWEAAGGAVLIVEAVVIGVGYPLAVLDRFPASAVVFVLLTMALPPLIAGTLFLLAWRKSRG